MGCTEEESPVKSSVALPVATQLEAAGEVDMFCGDTKHECFFILLHALRFFRGSFCLFYIGCF